MTDINCLYFEHDREAYEKYTEHLRVHWETTIGGEISFDHVDSLKDAIEKLNSPADTYHIFISDILFPPIEAPQEHDKRKHRPTYKAVEYARTKERLLVIALSIGDKERYPFLADDARKAGADIAKYIPVAFSNADLFCREIHEALVRERIIRDPTPLDYDDNDARLCHIVHEIGETTLKSLYNQILAEDSGIERLKLSYLAPGMSGAFVLRVEAQRTRMPTLTHLFKASTNRKRLSVEIERCPKGGLYASRLVVNYLDKVAQVGEWYAIGASFEKYTKPFKVWLTEKHKKSEIGGVMAALFLEGGLKEGYDKNLNDKDQPKRAVETLMPNRSRQARIREAIEEFREVIVSSSLGGVNDWGDREKLLLNYLRSQQVGAHDAKGTPRNCFMCQCHGDLHSRNILVTTSAPVAPIIIDWADLEVYHWAADCARLIADMLLAVYDNGPVSHDWTRLSQWQSIAQRIISCQPLSQEGNLGNDNVVYVVNWIFNNINGICHAIKSPEGQESWRWEFQLALGVEFMRGGYRPDLTTPKRVLGLLAATDAIKAAEGNMP